MTCDCRGGGGFVNWDPSNGIRTIVIDEHAPGGGGCNRCGRHCITGGGGPTKPNIRLPRLKAWLNSPAERRDHLVLLCLHTLVISALVIFGGVAFSRVLDWAIKPFLG